MMAWQGHRIHRTRNIIIQKLLLGFMAWLVVCIPLAHANIVPHLAKMKSGCLQVYEVRGFGVTTAAVDQYVMAWLKRTLFRKEPDAVGCMPDSPLVWVKVAIGPITPGSAEYYGLVAFEVVRRTRWETGHNGWGIAYQEILAVTGQAKGVKSFVD